MGSSHKGRLADRNRESSTGNGRADDSNTLEIAASAVDEIWGGMQGDIWIVYPASDDIAKGISTHFTPEGDAAAVADIKEQLVKLYGTAYVHETTLIDLKNDRSPSYRRIRRSNLILIGGSEANWVSRKLLHKRGFSWLFPKRNPHKIRRAKDDAAPLTPVGKPPNVMTDFGVFLIAANPFNKAARLYGVMGAYRLGTEAVAAASCSEGPASEMISAKQKQLQPHICLWFGVENKSAKSGLISSDSAESGFRYQVIWSQPWQDRKWSVYHETGVADRSIEELDLSSPSEHADVSCLYRVALHARTVQTIAFGTSVFLFALALATVVACLLGILGWLALPLGAFVLVASGYTGFFSGLHLIDVTTCQIPRTDYEDGPGK